MKGLLQGYRRFRDSRWRTEHARYLELAQSGQRPETLVIACSDSRSDPSTIFDARPGELFVIRNIAAIVPPPENDGAHHGTSAAIAFAVKVVGVRNILVMGHAQCSGVAAALSGDVGSDVPFLREWIGLLSPAVKRADRDADDAEKHTRLERETVLLSMDNLRLYPFVAERVHARTLEIHGARFGIADGTLELFDPDAGRFVAVGTGA
jgi:carbonic anhydrase